MKQTPEMTWNEGIIASAIATQTLARNCVVLVPNCNWTGYECDVLAVTRDLRIIDVEVKISRSDLKADAHKDKWWHTMAYQPFRDRSGVPPRTHPPRVWKHYYALPEAIWKPELLTRMPSPASGVLLCTSDDAGNVNVRCARRATPARDAYRLKPEAVMNIARLANLRMWDARRALGFRHQEVRV